MKLARLSSVPLAVLLGLLATLSRADEDTRTNPYESIVARNPFQLKEPPPAPDPNEVAKPPPPPLATVEVTGVMKMPISSTKKAFLEIVPGPGKPAEKKTLEEGDRVDMIEVLFIDVDEGLVKIKNGEITTNIALRVPKPPTGAVPGVPPIAQPGFPPPVLQPATSAGIVPPTVNPSARSPNASAYDRGNVMVVGGTPAPAVPTTTISPGVVAKPSYGAYGGGAVPAAGVPNYGSSSGVNVTGGGGGELRPIPSRPIRATPQQSTTPQNATQNDPAAQYLNMAIQKQQMESRGRPMPPLPPIPGLDPNQ